MVPYHIPFQDAGINREAGNKILQFVSRLMTDRPNKSVDIQEVSELTGFSSSLVKEVFYLLLAFRVFKSTYIPRHRNCDRAIGPHETSIDEIRRKANTGEYGTCMICGNTVDSVDDIHIQILFWKPGAIIE
jgi:hypothetical protein